ncbi:uncharacterized protein B0I36DRAFT_128139 [Microdochium trichocladiopsis]|uniref:Uncharacterized protein n=1 Tax=Microdochium trichocladiopsis TaxID=1682393 RepID=A0A9P8Y6J5_9PEZI|nr:uncharacterized protein B0I36DRAFT_128139 [Microdochium trichocladiopsis]KAH7029076.1 hypothetical protein B0I36DRAFT_128139 [Microdochium trichocladiopsis]
MDGLVRLMASTGGLHMFPPLVQLHIRKADIKGAFERIEQPRFSFSWAYEPIWSSLSSETRDHCANRVRAVFSQSSIDSTVRETFVEIAYMAHVTETASKTGTMQRIELPRLTESHFYLINRLLTSPRMLTPSEAFIHLRSTDMTQDHFVVDSKRFFVLSISDSVEEALRISGLLFFKMVKGGARERWDQHVNHLWLLNGHLRRISVWLHGYNRGSPSSSKDISCMHIHDSTEYHPVLSARGLLIWASLIGEAAAAASEREVWIWPRPYAADPGIYREILAELLGSASDVSDASLPEEDLEFCRIFHLGILQNFFWDVRAEISRVLHGKP